ncbi:MAG: hypothetical protein K6F77_01280 [Lachnospiraceae bacterium]|nr:hypothetical protein [Lachnospiraceae bacterium]
MSKNSNENKSGNNEELKKDKLKKGSDSKGKNNKSNKDKKDKKDKMYFLPKTAFDWVCDIIILVSVVLFFYIVIPPTVKHFKDKKAEKEEQEAIQEAWDSITPTPAPTEVPEYITIYNQNIETSKEKNDTVFTLEFNSQDSSYKDIVSSGELSDSIDEGKFEEKDGMVITTSDDDQEVVKYIKEGDYLVVKDSLYDGKIPEDAKEHFKKTFTYKNKKTGIYRMLRLESNGKFQLIKAALNEDGEVDQANSTATTGKYKYDGQFIHLDEESDGSILLDYYVYEGKVTNAYYKRVTEEDRAAEAEEDEE